MRTFVIACLTLLAVAEGALCAEAATEPATAPAVELGRRHFNLGEGYSLCPPAVATRVQERAASRSVTWIARDKASSAIAWRLITLRESNQFSEDQAESAAETMAKDMQRNQGSTVESCQVVTVAGRKSVDIRAIRSDRGRMWRREVVIPIDGREVLTILLEGPAADRDRLLAIHQAALDSLELLDRKELLRQREANLAAGRVLLAGLTAEKLTAAVEKQDAWFLIGRDGKAAGFMAIRERATTVQGRGGVKVKAWLMVAAGEGVQKTVAVMVASADRGTETCNWVIASGDEKNPRALSMTKDGSKLVVAGSLGANPAENVADTVERVLDESMDGSYLPVAMNGMLGRLVDLKTAASYAFASYSGHGDALDVYTFTVVGAEEAELSGQKVHVIRAATRAAEDAEEQAVLLDQAGLVLRQETPSSAVIERSTRQEVLAQFPQAKTMLHEIDADSSADSTKEK